ncbi:type I secretion system permease/ATPase [Rhizobium sp. Root1220]|uniref:type I secretion system permease/ATPase n=1 Tax=Rhizobium sp. Root1220 TaxID=1736432 RepID=UPI0006F88D52|nr:type I secretion system permease/ATPase [Rhizobium sp. Root1220]KQV70345.1 type I secretion protein [Rhizobium sp. Root1220]
MRPKANLTGNKRRNVEKLTKGFRGIGGFLFITSGIINVLALTGSFYMLQIYDRALTSGSVPTLLGLSALAVGLYLFQGLFDIIRSQILVRMGARLDSKIAPLAHQVAIDMPRFGFSTAESLERGRDVDTVRSFLGSQGPVALFDLPWMPLYLIFIYILHPYLGALTFAGAFVLSVLAIVTELMTRRLAGATHKSGIERNTIADSNARNAETLKAMGFAGRAVDRFNRANQDHLDLQTRTNDISGTFGALSRVLRMILQSAVLGLGAWLTIQGELSAGAIIAASVASARALAPVDLAIGNWKGFVAARTAFNRLKETVVALAGVDTPMALPAPCGTLKVEKITVAAPGSGRVLLSEVSFEISAGQALGIIGPSGGGKTTLARALTGIWPTLRGSVRLDDAELTQWSDADLGQHIGYLPQDVALLDATIEENIARLEQNADPRAIVDAAQITGVHEMIVRMPDGYRTPLGSQGASLSAGQRQRIGLARALYRKPFIVIMDEPNSNLDGEGESALTQTIKAIRERGGIAVVIAHRPSALAAVDLVAVIQNGKMVAFGPKDEILRPTASTTNVGQPANTAHLGSRLTSRMSE